MIDQLLNQLAAQSIRSLINYFIIQLVNRLGNQLINQRGNQFGLGIPMLRKPNLPDGTPYSSFAGKSPYVRNEDLSEGLTDGLVKTGHIKIKNFLLETEEKDFGNSLDILNCDLSKEESIKLLFENIQSSYGEVNILVNNAARFILKSIEDSTDEDWNTVIDTNIKGD